MTLLQRTDQPQNLFLHGDVERGGRLVGNDELGLEPEGGGNQHTLAHATRKLVRIRAEHAFRIADLNLVEQRTRRAGEPLSPKVRA